MHYVFFGTPRFARIVLETVSQELGVPVAVVCNPDKPQGREGMVISSPVKSYVEEQKWDIPLIQEEESSELIERLKKMDADVYLVAAYGKRIPYEAIKLTPSGAVGVHPSLLPIYRGPSPIQNAIIDDVKTGVTLFVLDEEIDHGPIIAKVELKENLNEMYYLKAEEELARLGGRIATEKLPKYVKKELSPVPQNESGATYTSLITTNDAFIDFEDIRLSQKGDRVLAQNVISKIHALNPEPGTWTIDDYNRRIKLIEAKLQDEKLIITKLQYAGKKPRDFNGVL